jgi:hypothetical protein
MAPFQFRNSALAVVVVAASFLLLLLSSDTIHSAPTLVYGWSGSSISTQHHRMVSRPTGIHRSGSGSGSDSLLQASGEDDAATTGSTHSWDYDLAVVGGGVVGVQAALAAASGFYSEKRVCLIDAPREAGVLMSGDEDLSIGAPTGLFSKALRDTSKRIKVSTLRGMGLREDRYVISCG